VRGEALAVLGSTTGGNPGEGLPGGVVEDGAGRKELGLVADPVEELDLGSGLPEILQEDPDLGAVEVDRAGRAAGLEEGAGAGAEPVQIAEGEDPGGAEAVVLLIVGESGVPAELDHVLAGPDLEGVADVERPLLEGAGELPRGPEGDTAPRDHGARESASGPVPVRRTEADPELVRCARSGRGESKSRRNVLGFELGPGVVGQSIAEPGRLLFPVGAPHPDHQLLGPGEPPVDPGQGASPLPGPDHRRGFRRQVPAKGLPDGADLFRERSPSDNGGEDLIRVGSPRLGGRELDRLVLGLDQEVRGVGHDGPGENGAHEERGSRAVARVELGAIPDLGAAGPAIGLEGDGVSSPAGERGEQRAWCAPELVVHAGAQHIELLGGLTGKPLGLQRLGGEPRVAEQHLGNSIHQQPAPHGGKAGTGDADPLTIVEGGNEGAGPPEGVGRHRVPVEFPHLEIGEGPDPAHPGPGGVTLDLGGCADGGRAAFQGKDDRGPLAGGYRDPDPAHRLKPDLLSQDVVDPRRQKRHGEGTVKVGFEFEPESPLGRFEGHGHPGERDAGFVVHLTPEGARGQTLRKDRFRSRKRTDGSEEEWACQDARSAKDRHHSMYPR